MPAWVLPALSAAAPVVSGFMGNRARRGDADQSMKFSEKMRNTEWQAGVADMRAAGLNPALAYSQGGASAPGGDMARMENVGSDSASNAMSMKLMQDQRKLLDAQIWKTTEEARTAMYNQQEAGRENTLRQYRMGALFKDGQPTDVLKNMIRSEFNGTIANNSRAVSEFEMAKLRIPEQKMIAEYMNNVGPGGVGLQRFLAVLTSIIGRR